MNHDVSGDIQVEVHVFVELDVGRARRPVEYLQGNLVAYRVDLQELDDRMNTFQDLSLDHSL
jgi:hypothetical protein